jgi:hypothetical protein
MIDILQLALAHPYLTFFALLVALILYERLINPRTGRNR